MILLIDNYDSFTYNLYQLMARLGAEVRVVRNDRVTLSDLEEMRPEGIVISPGPGTPASAGVSVDVVRRFGPERPVLGICLGHQCIGAAFGGSIISAPELMHGKSSTVYHDGRGVFDGVPSPTEAIRYHSLALDATSVPDCLDITARAEGGTIMGLRHHELDIEGVQFHPESFMTPQGPTMVGNWLRRVARRT